MMGWNLPVTLVLFCMVCISASPSQHPQDPTIKGCCKPINGQWTMWTKYSPCSVSCGSGIRTRKRYCGNPAPQYGGSRCSGSNNRETIKCETKRKCPQNGNWTEFEDGRCSHPCKNTFKKWYGTKNITRSCTNPLPLHCGKKCDGDAIIIKECNRHPCREHDCKNITCQDYNGSCEKRCNTSCNFKDRSFCKPPYHTSDVAITKCNSTDGGWSDYKYGHCTDPCGPKGTKIGTRTCTNPKPVNCGKKCTGPAQSTFKCNRDIICPDPNCTTPCQLYGNKCQRRCNYTCPFENRYCKEPWYRNVTIKPCKTADGQWSGWKIGVCTKTCGGGVRIDTRKCNNPSPLNCGKDCVGLPSRASKCNEHDCPRYDNETCEGCKQYGNKCEQYCTRKCIYHKNDRNYCAHLGPIITKKPCETRDAGWSRYKFGACSKTCGGGFRTGKRVCDNPTRLNCGKPCKGSDTITEKCGTCPCPKWGPPINCGKCHQLKGGKCQRTCDRNCIFERNDKPYCGKDSTIKQDCKSVNGGWTDFKLVIKCGECDTQSKKVRHCTNPKPEGCGRPCVGQSVVIEDCKKCPDWGEWECSTCSMFTKGKCQRTCSRICHNKKEGCKGLAKKHEDCKCPVKGGMKG